VRVTAEDTGADLIVFAPSNPFVSIGTILAVPGIGYRFTNARPA